MSAPALHWPAKSTGRHGRLGWLALVYALLTGAHLPILRSLAMASLVTLGIIVGRRAISLRGWAWPPWSSCSPRRRR